jgi:hypothetical protein
MFVCGFPELNSGWSPSVKDFFVVAPTLSNLHFKIFLATALGKDGINQVIGYNYMDEDVLVHQTERLQVLMRCLANGSEESDLIKRLKVAATRCGRLESFYLARDFSKSRMGSPSECFQMPIGIQLDGHSCGIIVMVCIVLFSCLYPHISTTGPGHVHHFVEGQTASVPR